jgi:predicted tellurium resistance membrane protein TerC
MFVAASRNIRFRFCFRQGQHRVGELGSAIVLVLKLLFLICCTFLGDLTKFSLIGLLRLPPS